MSIFGSINSVTISGNLGREPDFNVSVDGMPIASFSIAVDGWDGKTKKPKTMWLKVTAFDKIAENVEKWTKKGTTVAVIGRLDENKWTTKDGIEKSMWQVVATDVTVLKNGVERQERTAAASSNDYLDALKKLGITPNDMALFAQAKAQQAQSSEEQPSNPLDDTP